MSGAPHLVHGHLVHGMGTELEAPVWPAITPEEAGAVLGRFAQAGRLIALHWHSPRPFSAATLVEAEGGRFIFKRHHRDLRSLDALMQEHGFIAHLRAAGVNVPEVMAAEGCTAIARGEWTYELHRLSPGLDLYRERHSWTGFLSPDHASAAGRALARLHLAARDYAAPPRGTDPLIAGWTILPASDPMAAVQAYVTARPALARFLQDRPWREEMAGLLCAVPPGLAEQAPLWTHNDWHPSNLLWTPEGEVATIFDFGLATQSCALHDLATALERSAIPWLEMQDGAAIKGDVGAALGLITAYREMLPLSLAELDTLLALLPLVHVEFALSEVDYFAGLLNDPAQAAMAWDGYLIGHARWFASAAGQAFLADVRRGAGA
ncbi:phosphotransferase enzyme family protein [Novosphingobium sediminicola]|nr:phosphotransferase [Novosphingobium sediminicola]